VTSLFSDTFLDVVAIVCIVLLAGWLWTFVKKRSSSADEQDGEQWEIVEFRPYRGGHVFLSRSSMNGRWSVHGNLSADVSRTITNRYPTEQKAREDFARYSN
jgi:hypothetical protein